MAKHKTHRVIKAGQAMANGDAGSFEVDRTDSGKVRINVVSLANLVALIGLIGTAIATWNGLTTRVDSLGLRVEMAGATVSQIKSDMNSALVVRDADNREIRVKVELLTNRITAVETILKRVEDSLINTQQNLPRKP